MNKKTDSLPIGSIPTPYEVWGEAAGIRRMAALGYSAVDYQKLMHPDDPFFTQPTEDFLRAVRADRALFEGCGLVVSQAHAPWYWPPRDTGADWVASMKKALRGCAALGCGLFVAHPIMPYRESDRHPEEVFARNVDFFAHLADVAADLGIVVCMENLPWKSFPLSSVEATVRTVEATGRENVGVCLDTGHAHIVHQGDMAAAVKAAGRHLKALHLHDNRGDADRHLVPGEGSIDWEAFATALGEIGFAGTLSLETGLDYQSLPAAAWADKEQDLYNRARQIAARVR